MKSFRWQGIAIVLCLLVISMYFHVGYASAEEIPTQTSVLPAPPSPGAACLDQHTKTNIFVQTLDNDIIGGLETVASIMFAICTTMSVIDQSLSTLTLVVGSFSGDCCTVNAACPGPCGAPCVAMQGIYSSWSKAYKLVQPVCCFVNCGWCTGEGCGGIISNVPLLGGEGYGAVGDVIGDLRLSPYDNIYTAVGCMCPIAILHNLRKLKTIYQTYNCCVEQSCKNGLSVEPCEKQLSEATCMYWEGSIYKTLIKVVAAILSKYIADLVLEMIGEGFLANCLLSLLEIARIPGLISSVINAWNWMTTTFAEPTCSDLGFDQIADDLNENYGMDKITNYRPTDNNGDGIFEAIASEKTIYESYDDHRRTQYTYDENRKKVARFQNSDGSWTSWSEQNYFEARPDSSISPTPDAEDIVTVDFTDDEYSNWNGYYVPLAIGSVARDNQGVLWIKTDDDEWKNTIDNSFVDDTAFARSRNALGGTYSDPQSLDEARSLLREENNPYAVGQLWVIPDPANRGSPSTYTVVKDENNNLNLMQTPLIISTSVQTPDESGHPQLGQQEKTHYFETEIGGEQATFAYDYGRLYKLNAETRTWEYAGDDYTAPRPPPNSEIEAQLKLAEQKRAHMLAEKNAYDATWFVLNFLLDEFAYPAVDDMCKEEWTSSESQEETPELTNNNAFDDRTSCARLNVTTLTADISTIIALPEGIQHTWSYSITNCALPTLEYTIFLNNSFQRVDVLTGSIGRGNTSSQVKQTTSSGTFESVCIQTNDPLVTERCFG